MKQTFSSGQTLLASEMNTLQANDYNWTVSEKSTDYQLAAADKGTRVVMNAGTATTITVPNSTFDAGDTVWLHSIGSGTVSVAAGTGITLNTAASTALAQWEGGSLYFTSSSSAIFFRGGGGVSYGAATGGSSSSITVGGESYTLLTFTSSGTLTVTKAGVFDVMLIGAGGGGGSGDGNGVGGGAGAGQILQRTIYLDANASLVIGAGGASNTNGGASYIDVIYEICAAGGAHGHSYGGFRTSTGASGGGAVSRNESGWYNVAGNPIAAAITGYAGGTTQAGTNSGGGGGGGGSAAVGGNGTTTVAGNGGAGYDVSAFIGGSALFKAAGGGGGRGTSVSSGGTGGSSIGGNANGGSAGANTASGGAANGNGGSGGSGGSGIIYVRFK
jgi:hypothetical protein